MFILEGHSTVLLLLAAAVTVARSQDAGFGFTLKFVRMCLRPEFIRELQTGVGSVEIECAAACAKLGSSCQGFQLTQPSGADGSGSSGVRCRALVFDRCSHMVRTDCSQFAWVFVRNQAGLPDGQLCPDGFGNAYFGSTYKMLSATSWTDGLSKCQSLPGLTKYSDANDRNETDYMYWIMMNVNSGLSFFVGGYRPGSLASNPWIWQACNTSVLPEVWQTGQPNGGAASAWLDIWYAYPHGVDDTVNSWPGLAHAL